MLFLPDRKLATKIGQENIFPENTLEYEESDLNMVNPEAVVAEILHEIKDQTQTKCLEKSTRERKVKFELGTIVSKDQGSEELNEPKKKVKTIYYGRDRSKSRTRLKEVQTGVKVRRNRSASRYNEAEIMQNLSKSVDEANTILMRRRADEEEPSSRHQDRVTFKSANEIIRSPQLDVRSPRLETRSEERFARRSRDEQRNRQENERRERSKRAVTNEKNIPNLPAQLDPAKINLFTTKHR